LTGCKPEFWKAHIDIWDGQGADDLTASLRAGDTFGTLFNDSNKDTLLTVLNYPDSGVKGLQRAATSALLSSDAMDDYPYSKADVVAMYRAAASSDDAKIANTTSAFEALEGECSVKPAGTSTPRPTTSPTASETPSGTVTPTNTPGGSATPTSTSSPAKSPTSVASASPTQTKTAAAIPTPSATPQP
jgi:hypothetical protein